MTYNQEKYLRYKKRQEGLNRQQVSLTLDEDIAITFQKHMKGEKRLVFEHQLKSCFLSKKSLSSLDNLLSKQFRTENLQEFMKNVDSLLSEVEESTKQMNRKMEDLQKALKKFMDPSYDNRDSKNITDIIEQQNNPIGLIQEVSQSKKHRIPQKVLELAINLYKNLQSWRKVSEELAHQGYLSRKKTPYNRSSLSRSVHNYISSHEI